MKWTEQQVDQLKELCNQGINNKDIAKELGCDVKDVYSKRSQLGITIDKCKVAAKPNPDFEKHFPQVNKKKMRKSVQDAYDLLQNELLLAMASDWTSLDDANLYGIFSTALDALKDVADAAFTKN